MKWDDSEAAKIIYSHCMTCKHYLKTQTDEVQVCEAFPKGIPFEIWSGKNKHKKPYPGDNGIQYEPIDEKRK